MKASSKPLVLIVDDDVEIRRLLTGYLQQHGFATQQLADGNQISAEIAQRQPDIVLLDLMLPGDDGLQCCRTIRAYSQVPIIMLTAMDEDTDRIVGLEMGADDYLAKPFVPRELLARIKAVLRRTNNAPSTQASEQLWHFADCQLDPATWVLTNRLGQTITLTHAEFKLLNVFLERPQRVLSRDQLLDLTSGRNADVYGRSIDLQISRLRQHLADNARESTIIKTMRGVGYMLAVTVQKSDRSG